MTELYRVVISGRTVSGRPLAEVAEQVGAAFKLQGEQLAQMLSGKPVILVKSATAAVAEQWLARLRSLDLEAMQQPLAPPPAAKAPAAPANAAPTGPHMAVTPSDASAAEIACPRCGEAQPKRTLCRQCGLDMPRYQQAQQEAAEEARAERQAALQTGPAQGAAVSAGFRIPTTVDGHGSGLIGIDFSGRLDYLTSGLVATIIWIACVFVAVATGKAAIVILGIVLSAIYMLRCLALRLHDTGRSGWLSLIAIVPILGALMTFALLFLPGNEDDNEYGAPPLAGGGRRLLISLVASGLLVATMFKQMTSNPENALKFAQVMAFGEAQASAGNQEDQEDESMPLGIRYAAGNRVDLYVIAGCDSCDQMQGWLQASGVQPVVYNVDSDPQAAERLHGILGGGAQHIMLPVLQVNGEVLPGNPDISIVHRHLRPAI